MEEQHHRPLFSVVIPTCERPEMLYQCLSALGPGAQHDMALVTEDSANAHYTYDVIVSDDGEPKGKACNLNAAFPWATIICGPGRGPAANRNHGASQSNGQWLVFTDDDCIPSGEWLRAFAEATCGNHAALEGKTVAERPRRRLDEESPVNEVGGFLWSCNFAIRRELFEDLEGFDESFPAPCMEDVDFALRLKKKGFQTKFIADAKVCHPWRPARRVWDNGHGGEIYYPALKYFLKKHPDRKHQFNTKRFFVQALRDIIKYTIPRAFRYKGQGVTYALRLHLYQLQIGWRLQRRPKSK